MVWDPCDQGVGGGALEGGSDFFWMDISGDFKERRKVKRKQKSGLGECISIALCPTANFFCFNPPFFF